MLRKTLLRSVGPVCKTWLLVGTQEFSGAERGLAVFSKLFEPLYVHLPQLRALG
jgi:hypothetical protein